MNCSLAGQDLAKVPSFSYPTDHSVVATRVLGLIGPALPATFLALLKSFVRLHVNRGPDFLRCSDRLQEPRFFRPWRTRRLQGRDA
jgi:hypothetical protein